MKHDDYFCFRPAQYMLTERYMGKHPAIRGAILALECFQWTNGSWPIPKNDNDMDTFRLLAGIIRDCTAEEVKAWWPQIKKLGAKDPKNDGRGFFIHVEEKRKKQAEAMKEISERKRGAAMKRWNTKGVK